MENIIITKTNNIEYLQFKKLLEFQDDLLHAYTLKTYNVGFNRKNNIDNVVEKSYDRLSSVLNIDKDCIIQPIQKHTDNIHEYKKGEEIVLKELDHIDGIITNKSNIATLLTFADCMSLLMYDPVNKVLANVHSGWQGTVKRIGVKAVQKMINDYSCKSENIICCFGPSIRKDHFLVNDDVVQIFQNEFSDICKSNSIIENTEFSNDKGKQYSIDTVLLNRILLKEAGLLDNNIIDSGICTMCHSDMFHSRRAQGEKYQVNGALMMLKN